MDLHARGRTGARHQGPGQEGPSGELAGRRVRLHLPDRRLGARRGTSNLEGRQLARQVVRHVRADRSLHRHRRRDRRAQRPGRPLLERRPAASQLQHRRYGAPGAGARRVRFDDHDVEYRRFDRVRDQPRRARRIAGRRDRGNRDRAHWPHVAQGRRPVKAQLGARYLYGCRLDQPRGGQAPPPTKPGLKIGQISEPVPETPVCLSSTAHRRRRMSDVTTATAAHLEADETHRLISSEKVDGTAVYDRRGERLGTVHHLMVDKYIGQVDYAVMSFGGFLGIGESYHPLPWKMLTYDTRQGGYVVDLDRSRLEGAPSYTSSTLPNWSDQSYRRGIDEYYGVPPYPGI